MYNTTDSFQQGAKLGRSLKGKRGIGEHIIRERGEIYVAGSRFTDLDTVDDSCFENLNAFMSGYYWARGNI